MASKFEIKAFSIPWHTGHTVQHPKSSAHKTISRSSSRSARDQRVDVWCSTGNNIWPVMIIVVFMVMISLCMDDEAKA